MDIQHYQKAVFKSLLRLNEVDPKFTFGFREKKGRKGQSVENGNIFIGPDDGFQVKLSSKRDNKSRSHCMGFNLYIDKNGNVKKNYFELTFRSIDFDNYKSLFQKFNHVTAPHFSNIKISNDGRQIFYFFNEPEKYIKNLEYYFYNIRPEILAILKQTKLEDIFIYSVDTFRDELKKIKAVAKL